MEAAWEEGACAYTWDRRCLGRLGLRLGLQAKAAFSLPAVHPPRVKTCSEKKAGRKPCSDLLSEW